MIEGVIASGLEMLKTAKMKDNTFKKIYGVIKIFSFSTTG